MIRLSIMALFTAAVLTGCGSGRNQPNMLPDYANMAAKVPLSCKPTDKTQEKVYCGEEVVWEMNVAGGAPPYRARSVYKRIAAPVAGKFTNDFGFRVLAEMSGHYARLTTELKVIRGFERNSGGCTFARAESQALEQTPFLYMEMWEVSDSSGATTQCPFAVQIAGEDLFGN